ncbi:hypothetical protein U8527_05340 [Kordia algicida OT-1]|uniref:Lipoprotein n=1 Tax=Kordia algicida OT-1 TaxID=391587 RepID=A9DMN2_9FLAO|nr:hypothetical protein [Kordia algicida]EDP97748.1 hypothetical protein KAOT1_21337 [Kordia algicida OT-1]
MVQRIIFWVFGMSLLIGCSGKVSEKETPTIQSQENIIQTDSVATNDAEIIAPKGSQVFSESVKLRYLSILHGYILRSINVSECEGTDVDLGIEDQDKSINSLSITKDAFTVQFSVVENCCSAFLCEAEIVEETTLNIIYQPFGRHCSCNCQFDMEYTFQIDDTLEDIGQKLTKIKHIQFNNEPTSKVEFKEY